MHMSSMPRMPFTPSRKLVVGLLAVIALLAVPTVATPARTIVLHDPQAGSTLTLNTKGRANALQGRKAHRDQPGCHFTRGHRVAVCSTRGADAIEVQMGPAG